MLSLKGSGYFSICYILEAFANTVFICQFGSHFSEGLQVLVYGCVPLLFIVNLLYFKVAFLKSSIAAFYKSFLSSCCVVELLGVAFFPIVSMENIGSG